MEELDIKKLIDYFKSKLIFLILIVIFTVIVGVSYKLFLEHPKYESTTSLILAGFNNNDKIDSIDNNELTINQKLVTTYQEITKSEKVLSQVIKKLKLDYEIEELANKISVTSVPETEIIKITVYDENPKLACKIVTNIAEVFSEEVKDIYNVSNVSVLDKARVAKESSNIKMVWLIIISIIAGIIFGSILIIIFYYFDTTIKTVEQIENRFDVPVLGSIPIYNSKKKKGGKK